MHNNFYAFELVDSGRKWKRMDLVYNFLSSLEIQWRVKMSLKYFGHSFRRVNDKPQLRECMTPTNHKAIKYWLLTEIWEETKQILEDWSSKDYAEADTIGHSMPLISFTGYTLDPGTGYSLLIECCKPFKIFRPRFKVDKWRDRWCTRWERFGEPRHSCLLVARCKSELAWPWN